jgi:hypothetical protein
MGDISLSATEAKVFKAWEGTQEDFGYLSFSATASRSGVELHRIRRSVRSIARKGLLEFGKGLWTEDGEVAGSGYGLTPAGRQYLDNLSDPHAPSSPSGP